MDDLKSLRNLCRVCLGRPESYEMLLMNTTLIEKITYIGGSAEVENVEDLPQFICYHCEAELDFVYNFITKLNVSKLQIKQYLHNKIFGKDASVSNTSFSGGYQIVDLNPESVDITEGYGTGNDAEDDKSECCIEIVKMEKSPLPCESPLRVESLSSENPLQIDEDKPPDFLFESVGEISEHMAGSTPQYPQKLNPEVNLKIEPRPKPGPKSKTRPRLNSTSTLMVYCKTKFESSSTIVSMSNHEVKTEPGEKLKLKRKWKKEQKQRARSALESLPPYIPPSTDAEQICYICHKQFSTRANMLRHVREHLGRRFICDFENCNSYFTQRSSLQVHIARHQGLKPFSCDICNKKFSQSKSLVFHTRIHTGESPYICYYCDKRFKQKSNLIRHFKSHRKPKSDRRMYFQCHKCEKNLASKQSLIRHLALHDRPNPVIQINPIEPPGMQISQMESAVMQTNKIDTPVMDINETEPPVMIISKTEPFVM